MRSPAQLAARVAIRRWGLPQRDVYQALEEVERARSGGGLASLGSVLQQQRVICAMQALELNAVERRAREHQAPAPAPRARRFKESGTTRGLVLRVQERARAVEALDAAWERMRARVLSA